MGNTISIFFSGALMMGLFIAGLFFFRFWKETKQRFFFSFSFAFWLLALERIFLTLYDTNDFTRAFFYTIRLIAFTMMAIAILKKGNARLRAI